MRLHNQHVFHNHDVLADHHLLDHFYVITPVSNPVRYQSRYRLFREFEERMHQAGVKLVVAELIHGDRAPKITKEPAESCIHNSDPFYPKHLRFYGKDELWHKENIINLAIQRLPPEAEYIAWVDCDIEFLRPDWALETVQQLQHYKIVQMFQTAIEMGPTGEALNTYHSFGWSHVTGQELPGGVYGGKYAHPGYGWAARRESLGLLGNLLDLPGILGSSDHHMAMSLIGRGKLSIPKGIHSHYTDLVLEWEKRATKHIKGDFGFVPGTIAHHHHGPKIKRGYVDRWSILRNNDYDPYTDVYRDHQGLLQLSGDKPQLRDDIRTYFRSRSEDDICTE